MSTPQPTSWATAPHRGTITASAHLGTTAVLQVRDLLPAGWRATCHQSLPGTTRATAVDAPTDTADATAHVLPHVGEQPGRSARIHDRTHRTDYPLYRAGGAHIAVLDTVEPAATAAVTANGTCAGTRKATTETAAGTPS